MVATRHNGNDARPRNFDAYMPKLSDFITQFKLAELLITLGIILLIVGIRERFNIKKIFTGK